MNAVDPAKAGVASGILSMSRMVGGTFGVAVLGALVSTLGSERLAHLLPGVPAATREALTAGLGSGAAQGGSAQVVQAGHEAFVYALQNGLRLGAAVALTGAIVAWTMIGRERAGLRRAAPIAAQPAAGEPAAARIGETVGV
jgi:hypothetical protein